MSPVIRVRENALMTELENEAVVLNIETEKYYWLDDIATVMWKALCHYPTIDSVVAALLELYDVDEKTLRTDLQHLINEFQQEELIELAP
jgi:hypothetical protein